MVIRQGVASRPQGRRVAWAVAWVLGAGVQPGGAVVTMGYRFAAVPVEVASIRETAAVRSAPAKSPMFGAGDQLRDVTSCFRERKIPLKDGWAIWNETRHLLVVRGSLAEQWVIEEATGFSEQSKCAKLRIEWLRGEEDAGPPLASAPAWAAVTTIGHSGSKASGKLEFRDQEGPWSFSAETETTVGSLVVDARLTVEWTGSPGGVAQHGSVKTAVSQQGDRTVPLASWQAAGRGPAWWLRLASEILLADGSPLRDACLRKDGDKTKPRGLPRVWFTRLPTAEKAADGRRLVVLSAPRDHVARIFELVPQPQPANPADPFAEPEPASGGGHPHDAAAEPSALLKVPELTVPEALKPFVGGPLLDFRALINSRMGKLDVNLRGEPNTRAGKLDPDDLVGYDPFAELLFVLSRKQDLGDLLEGLFSGCQDPPVELETTISLTDLARPAFPLGRASLVCNSGRAATLDWCAGEKEPLVILETEATFGSRDDLADLHFFFTCRPSTKDGVMAWHRNAVVTVPTGREVAGDEALLPDGRRLLQAIKVRVLQEELTGE